MVKRNIKKTILFIVLSVGFFALANVGIASSCPSNTTVDGTSVNFVGELTDTGGEATSVWFQYGKNSVDDNETESLVLDSNEMYCIEVSNLDSCATYYYRAAARNSAGTSYGAERTFTTACDEPGSLRTNIKADGLDTSIDVEEGASVNLTWTSENADSCEASGNWSGSKNTSGSFSTEELSKGTYTYILTCSENSDSSSDSVTVNVHDPQVLGAATGVKTGIGNSVFLFVVLPALIAGLTILLFRPYIMVFEGWVKVKKRDLTKESLRKKIEEIKRRESQEG